MNIPAYPKIFTIGQRYTSDLFNHPVEITEKLDGSQFGFGIFDGELIIRSKGKIIYEPDKMFQKGWDYIHSIRDTLPNGLAFYGEYFQKPKHNTLAYESVPLNNIALFGAVEYPSTHCLSWHEVYQWAKKFELDMVPILFQGQWNHPPTHLLDFLELESTLGGVKIEGVVVKNYQPVQIGSQILPFTSGKYVCEKFKELNHKTFSTEKTNKGNWLLYVEGFKTEARWEKAIQHLRDSGKLTDSPKDIGPLIKEINNDIQTEHLEEIKEVLWKTYGKDILRKATAGFPEWYKERLLRNL